jgi:2-amino-4-hydroxy-6-hydroxymethyldihydropteridine diphosphokinase
VERLNRHDGISVEARSSVYETEPVGDVLDQPDFLNAAVRVETTLGAFELLDACKAIERDMGRVEGTRHGPRLIDVDLLLVEGAEIESRRLRLPHPEVTSRRFVLVPLLELEPPGAKQLRDALQGLPTGQRVERVGDLMPAPE